MYALVEIAGQQFRVQKDAVIKTQKLQPEIGSTVSFDRVLMVADGERVTIGTPTVAGAAVQGTIVDHFRDDKVIVFKKRRRKGYRRTRGHRQPRTAVRIDALNV